MYYFSEYISERYPANILYLHQNLRTIGAATPKVLITNAIVAILRLLFAASALFSAAFKLRIDALKISWSRIFIFFY